MNPSGLAMPAIAGLTPYQPGKPVEELERELGIAGVVKLASNENPLGPSSLALAAVRRQLSESARYPDGGGFRLKQALAARHGVPLEAITLGNGSNDVLDLVGRVFLGPGRNAVFSEHAFAVYPLTTQAVGAAAHVAPARDWGHDLQAMADRVDQDTRVVFIANPNNPTGGWLAASELEGFVANLPPEVMVVVDEAYAEYVQEPGYPDTTAWTGRFPNVMVTRTFSKAFGLAGLRVGYGVSDPAVADLLNRVRQPFNVNSLALAGAEAALGDMEHLALSQEVNRRGMAQLTSAFAGLGLEWIPSVGNFVCVDTGRPGAQIYDDLLRLGVIVRPVANYGLPTHLRVSIGLEGENQRLIEALTQVLAL